MNDNTKPFLSVYVVWHPDFSAGTQISERIRDHFRRKIFGNVTGGTGISVLYRSQPIPHSSLPETIDFSDAETTAVVVLLEHNLAKDPIWVEYLSELSSRVEDTGLAARLIPISIERDALSVGIEDQAIRWDRWDGDREYLHHRLTNELTYQFCRMLRHYLAQLKHPKVGDEELLDYLKKVQVFLSHSKHDSNGERIALKIRDFIHAWQGLSSFFDVHDIPAGIKFHKAILVHARTSAMIAVHSDTYSSREWCRREVIEAKKANVPLIVANCIDSQDERSFPYLGNVPIVRLDPITPEPRLEFVIGKLLDEVLKDFLWKCQTELWKSQSIGSTYFFPRHPELISLIGLYPIRDSEKTCIVYPDPPLSVEEVGLFTEIAPHVTLRSYTEWTAEN